MLSLTTPVLAFAEQIPRVGSKTALALATSIAAIAGHSDIQAATVDDLLYYLPLRYENRANLARIVDLQDGTQAAVAVEVRVCGNYKVGRETKHTIFELSGLDATGRVRAYWWNQPFLEKVFVRNSWVILYGVWKYDSYRRLITVENPEYEMLETSDAEDDPQAAIHMGRAVPIYRRLGDLRTKQLRSIMFHVLQQLDPSTVTDFIPQEVRERQRLLPRVDALRELHFPSDQATLDLYNRAASPAHCRIIFEEFFWLVLALAIKRQHRAAEPKGTNIELTDRVRQALLQILPFKPTNAQKRVLKEIVTDMASTKPMNRMLQGDVGAGKTIVAAQAAVVAIENGYQVALMVPTEILAEQHARNFRRLWEKTNYRVELLVGSLPAKQKRAVHTALREGEINLVVGTHALIQDKVDFAQLGLVIIDEQHRFGVIQRAQLIRRGQHPDVLVMTATPIPRSLTMTVYGDLDISIIDELPPGRTPIQTRLCGEKQRAEVYEFIKQQIACGYQCYIVYPLVEESEKIDLLAATAMAEKLQKEVFPELTVALLHGRMKAFEKEEIMQKFIYNEAQILVSTTVIEVGVDVPNASVMLIEHAERFGLSQIHQLRGRVGRGATQSYCLLMSEAHSREALARLRVLEKTTDGFKIAEKDLEIRGPGDVFGTRQAGEQFFRIANIVRDRSLLEAARHEAEYLLQSRREHPEVKHLIEQIASQARFGWAKVG